MNSRIFNNTMHLYQTLKLQAIKSLSSQRDGSGTLGNYEDGQ